MSKKGHVFIHIAAILLFLAALVGAWQFCKHRSMLNKGIHQTLIYTKAGIQKAVRQFESFFADKGKK